MKNLKNSLTVSALVILSLSGCRRPAADAPDLTAFPVRVQKARTQALEETLAVVGSVKARDEAVLYSRVPGKIIEYPFREGAPVRKGDPVVLVERDEVGVVYKPAPVPSPLTGVVARTYLDKGAHVDTDTPLALVVDNSEMRARADVPERYAARVQVGQAARVAVGAEKKQVYGRVVLIGPLIDPATRSFPIEIRLNERGGLISGMFADVTVIVHEKKNALVVPPEAIVGEDGGAPSVFVASNGKAALRPVRLGIKTTDAVEILSGVTEGEDVVTFGLFALQDGSPIAPMAEEVGASR